MYLRQLSWKGWFLAKCCPMCFGKPSSVPGATHSAVDRRRARKHVLRLRPCLGGARYCCSCCYSFCAVRSLPCLGVNVDPRRLSPRWLFSAFFPAVLWCGPSYKTVKTVLCWVWLWRPRHRLCCKELDATLRWNRAIGLHKVSELSFFLIVAFEVPFFYFLPISPSLHWAIQPLFLYIICGPFANRIYLFNKCL